MLFYSRFKANYWHRPTAEDLERGVKRHEMPRSIKRIHMPSLPRVGKEYTNGHHHHEPPLECLYSATEEIKETDVEEVWFAGAHCGMFISQRKSLATYLASPRCRGWICRKRHP